MPLPAALLERLKKRGIIQSGGTDQPSTSSENDKEEVIAEDYDDDKAEFKENDDKEEQSDEEPGPVAHKIATVTGCPNKTNLYHDCTEYCLKRFGSGKDVPSPPTERKYRVLLRRFPLPSGWQDVWEPGLARYYFWNTATDEVSWYPPLHPKARITMSINRMRALLRSDKKREPLDDESSGASSDSLDEDASDGEEDEEPRASEQRITDLKIKRQPSRKMQKRNDLDPMDPAAYSEECPRGRWSDGLRSERDGDKAADSTASGPLYQMRPYPSPGEILRMNQKK